MYPEAVGLATSTYKEGFERGGESIFIASTSLTYLHAAEPILINIFGDSEKIVEKDIVLLVEGISESRRQPVPR